MEPTVNKHDTLPKNLHPIWHRHFGLQTLQPSAHAVRQPARAPQSAHRNDGQFLLRAVQALVASRGPVKHTY